MGKKEKLKELDGLEGVSEQLRTNLQEGLYNDETDFGNRRLHYGNNVYPSPPGVNWFVVFFESFKEAPVIVLSIAAIIALTAGIIETALGSPKNEWIDGLTIIVAVFLVAGVTATNEYSKDRQFRKLKEQSSDRPVRVIRGGKDTAISIFDICVGDIVLLHTGDKIPADGLVIPGLEDIIVDESSFNGEPEPKRKNAKDPFLISGTNVTKGAGRMLAIQVGVNSEYGKTMAKLTGDSPDTPLQEKLEGLVILIGKIGFVAAAATFLVLAAYYIDDYVAHAHITWTIGKDCLKNETLFFDHIKNATQEYIPLCPYRGTSEHIDPTKIHIPSDFQVESLLELLLAFIIGITIIVVAVPEGLPLAVTISLAYSISLMAKDQNLVRKLQACEVMGGATNICSDKTGTLTMNRMSVEKILVCGEECDNIAEFEPSAEIKRTLIDACCLNIEDGIIEKKSSEPGGYKFRGNVTECAMLVFVEKLGAKPKKIQKKNPPVHKWGFTSARKRMSTVISRREEDGFRLNCKGAADWVLKLCTHILKPDGTVEKMSKSVRKAHEDRINDMASLGLRNICLAYRDFEKEQKWESSESGEEFEEGLICIGIVSIQDPLRPEVTAAVHTCQTAGITVRMVTGDNILTAKTIARECGIFNPDKGGVAMEGPDFEKLTDDELDKVLPHLQVLARSSPSDKYRLVTRLQHNGEVVAVTGDGTNDGPALKAADVGLAMGITGTEVAKEAADIIILDDNFASIVKAAKWGRCIFDNIRKFIQFQLTVNVSALITAFIGAIARYGTPLTAVQLLWVNLIMDTMAALALGTEKPTDDLLKRKPYGREGRLITWTMWRNVIGQSIWQVISLCVVLYAVDQTTGYHMVFPWVESGREAGEANVHYTILFNSFVWLQVFNEFNSRKLGREWWAFDGLHTNVIFAGVILFTSIVQAIFVEFGGQALNCTHLDWRSWLVCLCIGFISIPYGAILRQIPVPLEDWEVVNEDDADLTVTTDVAKV
eukprot:TRINITY_DN10311_c0_g1_i1.p1 TRINITY_DN10311_c0_g1~~TRINITY_DN10311_c0_g1_i1.p1  ORF type:complete len:1026 (-),score=288.69 TRINITY_DN10311_c0_g1_i1:85-3075(-)